MKSKLFFLLVAVFIAGRCNGQDPAQKLLDTIFKSRYSTPIISRGDNRPDFDRRKDSVHFFLVALHERIDPEKFREKAGWSEDMMKDKIQFLKSKNWLLEDEKELKPTVFIASAKQGTVLYRYGKPLAEEIAQSIEKEIPSIREKFQRAGLTGNYSFDSLSFLVLSNVLLDNWQIMEMEGAYLKQENRPLRHGKHYYAGLLENNNYPKEPFGIFGNQFYAAVRDSTALSIYGNNRFIPMARLAKEPDFRDSLMNVAPKLTPVLYNLFDSLSAYYRPTLLNILSTNSDYSHSVYTRTGYSDEITFEEFFIWWYHFIYTEATDILAKKKFLVIPRDGNFYYRN